MKDLLGGGVDVSKRSTSIIADGDRLEVNNKTEMGEEVELEDCATCGESKSSSSIMADS